MPVFKIQSLPQAENIDTSVVMKNLCKAVSDAIGMGNDHLYATWDILDADKYIHHGKSAGFQPTDTHPPLIHVYAFTGKTEEFIEDLLKITASFLCETLGLDKENIFITYDEVPSKRAYSGGEIIIR